MAPGSKVRLISLLICRNNYEKYMGGMNFDLTLAIDFY